MKHIDLNMGTVGVGHTTGNIDIAELENKWEGKMREVAARIYGMAVFS